MSRDSEFNVLQRPVEPEVDAVQRRIEPMESGIEPAETGIEAVEPSIDIGSNWKPALVRYHRRRKSLRPDGSPPRIRNRVRRVWSMMPFSSASRRARARSKTEVVGM